MDMENDRLKVFIKDGILYKFNSKVFRECVDHYARERHITKTKAIEEIADKLCATKDKLNKWKYGDHGPGDLDTIEELADLFRIDWMLLLRKVDGGTKMKQLTERQKDAAKRIYDVLIWSLDEFRNSDGLNSWWTEFRNRGTAYPEDDVYERITRYRERVGLVLNQEYFDLHDHEIYDALCEFAGEDLTDLYDYAFRFEGDDKTAPTVWQNYEKAMQQLNGIIERYV